MKVVNASTSLGKRLMETAQKFEGIFLAQVYDKYSTAKAEAWDKCYEEYCNTKGAYGFSICSYNSFNFSCSWFTPDGIRLETSKNSYLIVFDN